MPFITRSNSTAEIGVAWWLWISITGNFARGTGAAATTSVDFGLYSRMFGGGNSGCRPSAGRGRTWPDAVCSAVRSAARRGRQRLARRRDRSVKHQVTVRAESKVSQRAVSRILSLRRLRGVGVTTIPLAPPSLAGSSDRPGDSRRAVRSSQNRTRCRRQGTGRLPIWSCSVRGFACHLCCHGRGALLPHLFTLTLARPSAPGSRQALAGLPDEPVARVGRYIFCATVLQVTLTGRYPAHCPAEFGLSSPLARRALDRSA